MMRILRKGERYALNKPIKKNNYLFIYRKSGLVTLLICLFCFQFVCLAQESPAGREATEVGEIKPLQIGDTIPEELWHMPLQVINHPDGKDTITLNDYRDKKLIILDFWATWCKPCVISVNKWEEKLDSIPKMSFVPVHMDFEDKALPFILKQGWKSPSVVGEERKLLNKLFFQKSRITRSVWILDGRFVAVTGYNGPDAATILDVIYSGRSIPSLPEGLYSPLY